MEWTNVIVKEEPASESLPEENVKQEWQQDVESAGSPEEQEPMPELVLVPSMKQESQFEEELSDDVLAPKVELTIEQHSIALGEERDADEPHSESWNTAESSSSVLSNGLSEWYNRLVSKASSIENRDVKEKNKRRRKLLQHPVINTATHTDHSGEQHFVCDQCKRCFSRRSILVQHLRIHSGDNLLKCEECGKGFCRRSNLKDHMRMHSGEKMYKCDDCGKNFSRRAYLRDHMTVHTGVSIHKCEECGKCFPQRSNLAQHRKIHVGEKLFKCEECGKCFRQRSNLGDHLRSHSGEKPYKCEECGRYFSRQDTLKHHLRIHTGEKLYKCEKCGKSFTHPASLRTHLRIHSS